MAAPVFKRIAEQVLAYLDVPRDVPLNPKFIQTAYMKQMSEQGSALEDSAAVDFSGQPDPPPTASQPVESGGRVQKASHKEALMVAVDEGGDIEVPDFSEKTMRDVTDVVLRLGLEPALVGSGLATEQSPPSGTKVRRGAKITVQFGTTVEKKSKPRSGIRN